MAMFIAASPAELVIQRNFVHIILRKGLYKSYGNLLLHIVVKLHPFLTWLYKMA
jgi:hypothetical protein